MVDYVCLLITDRKQFQSGMKKSGPKTEINKEYVKLFNKNYRSNRK